MEVMKGANDMARKKQNYADMLKSMAAMQMRMEAEKKRMADIMADALMSSAAAASLGDLSDADIRRVMALLAQHIPEYAEQVRTGKRAKAEPENRDEGGQM